MFPPSAAPGAPAPMMPRPPMPAPHPMAPSMPVGAPMPPPGMPGAPGAPAAPMPDPPPPPPPRVFDVATFQAACGLLRDQKLRGFRVDIETQSTIAADEAQERADASEFVQALGAMMQSSLPMMQAMPAVTPLIGSFMLFVARRYGRRRRARGQARGCDREARGQPGRRHAEPEGARGPDETADAAADDVREAAGHGGEAAARAAENAAGCCRPSDQRICRAARWKIRPTRSRRRPR